MSRREDIEAAAKELAELEQRDFILGCEWADANPPKPEDKKELGKSWSQIHFAKDKKED